MGFYVGGPDGNGIISPEALAYQKRQEMPQSGAAWSANPSAADKNGYRKDDCLFNLAWNQLKAAGEGQQNNLNDVMARVAQLVTEYNTSAAKDGGKPISSPNDVTSTQLTGVENTYTADNPGGAWW